MSIVRIETTVFLYYDLLLVQLLMLHACLFLIHIPCSNTMRKYEILYNRMSIYVFLTVERSRFFPISQHVKKLWIFTLHLNYDILTKQELRKGSNQNLIISNVLGDTKK